MGCGAACRHVLGASIGSVAGRVGRHHLYHLYRVEAHLGVAMVW